MANKFETTYLDMKNKSNLYEPQINNNQGENLENQSGFSNIVNTAYDIAKLGIF